VHPGDGKRGAQFIVNVLCYTFAFLFLCFYTLPEQFELVKILQFFLLQFLTVLIFMELLCKQYHAYRYNKDDPCQWQ